jgi:hypothetical protein
MSRKEQCGVVHRKTRARFVRRMAAGEVFHCWRPGCGKRIDPANWDLGHLDREHQAHFGSRWPECVSCNRATLPRMLANARGERSDGPRFGGLPDPTPGEQRGAVVATLGRAVQPPVP